MYSRFTKTNSSIFHHLIKKKERVSLVSNVFAVTEACVPDSILCIYIPHSDKYLATIIVARVWQ